MAGVICDVYNILKPNTCYYCYLGYFEIFTGFASFYTHTKCTINHRLSHSRIAAIADFIVMSYISLRHKTGIKRLMNTECIIWTQVSPRTNKPPSSNIR